MKHIEHDFDHNSSESGYPIDDMPSECDNMGMKLSIDKMIPITHEMIDLI